MKKESNFTFLLEHDPIFFQLAFVAEKMFKSDPNTTLVKLRQLGEALAQEMASKLSIASYEYKDQFELIGLLEEKISFSPKVRNLFHTLRKESNKAVHEFETEHHEALKALKDAYKLSIWFHGTFGNVSSDFKVKPFVVPKDPSLKLQKIHRDHELLKAKLLTHKEELEKRQELAELKEREHQEYEKLIEQMREIKLEQKELIVQQERAFEAEKELFERKIAELSCSISDEESERLKKVYKKQGDEILCLLHLDEDETFELIDLKLNEAGWEADYLSLDYQKGTVPNVHENMAIANWEAIDPSSGVKSKLDYVLFIGLKPVAIVEVTNASTALEDGIVEAQKGSQTINLQSLEGFALDEWYANSAKIETYRVPMVFSSNGREYNNKKKTETGILFRDLRRLENRPRVILQWFSPDEIAEFLDRDDENLVEDKDSWSFSALKEVLF